MSMLFFILIGIAAGYLAGPVMRGGGFGWLVNLIVGIIGALLGGWLSIALNLNFGEGIMGSLISAFLGAVIFLFVIGLVKKK